MGISKTIAFLGGGNMAEALIKGLLAAGVARSDTLIATDISPERLEHLKKTYGIIIQKENKKAATEAEILLLCVKPQVMAGLLDELAPAVDDSKLVISIAAGIKIETIESGLGGKPRVVRVMPNTPALVLAGAAALSSGTKAGKEDMAAAEEIFNSVGTAVEVDERLMDAVTGLSGSGPAYVFTFIEGLVDAGVKAGLTREMALDLAAQTVFGAAKMVLDTGEAPGQLRDKVTSPGGTTIAGLQVLEKEKFRDTIISAVKAAAARSRELGKKKN